MSCERIARDFLLDAASTSEWTAHHVDEIVTAMASDAQYHVFAWHEPFVGHDAIRGELLRQTPLFSPDGCEIINVASVGRTVFIERIDRVVMDGARFGVHVVGVLEVDANGKIASWRDYCDSAEIALNLRPRGPSAQ
jgi:limonene-1,2-epoxide hydrolase